MTHRHRALIQRLDNGPGVRQRLYVQPSNRGARWKWFDVEDVPAFDGDSAYFEIDLVKGKWTVVGTAP